MNETASQRPRAGAAHHALRAGPPGHRVLDLDELLAQIPQLIARLTRSTRSPSTCSTSGAASCTIAYSVGYPERRRSRCALQGRRGPGRRRGRRARRRCSSTTSTPIRATSTRVPGMTSELVVPLRHKARVDRRAQPAQRHRRISSPTTTRRCCASSARTSPSRSRTRGCSSRARRCTSTLETLAEIGREVGAILDLDELLTRIAQLDAAA